MSLAAAQAGADWIVWPETAVPGFVELDPEISESLRGLARSEGVVLIVGGMGIEPDPEGLRRGLFFDSAFVVDRAGELVDRYDKTKLVPFGEFVPLRGLLGHFFKALATGLSTTDVTEGPGARVITGLDEFGEAGADGAPSELQMGVPICYELLFPRAVRGFAVDGADVLLAITNDAWYGRTGAPHQFLAMTALRAAENGLWLVRAANTGVSAVIDDRGRVRERSALFEEATVMSEVPVRAAGPRTLYAQFGDVFAGACLVWTGWGLARARNRTRRAAGAA